jgi:putative redox protein
MSDTKTGRVEWRDGLNFHAVGGSGFALDFSSTSPAEGGSPMEIALLAAAGCTAMDVISILQKKRQNVTDFAIEISGRRADEHPKVYTEMSLTYVLAGEGIDPAAVERAIELSMTKYCSVSIMFKQAGIKFNTDFRIEEPAVAAVA